jgi:hypothetical protein
MKKILTERRIWVLFGTWLCLSAAPALAQVTSFIHRATPSNIKNNWTVIDHPSTNGAPNAILVVTPNYNPGGRGGTYLDHPIGVWFTDGRWAIFNQDRAPMPEGAAFNVLVASGIKELKLVVPRPGAAAEAGAPQRKVRGDGHVEIVYPDRTTVDVVSGMKTVTQPDGTVRRQAQAQVPFATPPVPGDTDTVRWLDHHNEALLSVIQTLVSNDEASVSNYLRQEENVSLLGKIDKRSQTIQFLLSPP